MGAVFSVKIGFAKIGVAQCPVNFGLRFSANAIRPSIRSVVSRNKPHAAFDCAM